MKNLIPFISVDCNILLQIQLLTMSMLTKLKVNNTMCLYYLMELKS
jgi:hypothetical protein